MIRTVYVEILADIPFNQHNNFIQLQRINGIDMGTHHDKQKGAKSITIFLGEKFHEDLIEFLLQKVTKISLMVDGSTLRNLEHVMICYLTYATNFKTTTVFYRMLKIGVDETARALFDHLINAFKEDQIEEFMKKA